MVAGALGVPGRRSIDGVRRTWLCVLLVLGLAGCGGGSGPHRPDPPAHAPLPAAPISASSLTLSGRIVIVNGWEGVVTGQRLRVAAGRYRRSGEGVALVSDAGELEREVRAPKGEGALRFLRRNGARLELRSRAGHRFALDLRTLRLTQPGAPPPCPRGALPGPLPRLLLRVTTHGLAPLPAPRSDAFAALLAILNGAGGRVTEIDARPAKHAPCGLARRSLAARVSVATPRPIVSVVRRTVLVARFQRGWRAWRVQP
jgi:hypothetical protein